MKRRLNIIYFFVSILLCLTSCTDSEPQYVIGVSQCSGGDWRDKMNDEMRRAAIFHPGTSFIFRNAQDDPLQQQRDVEELIDANVNLLVIAPIDTLEGREIVQYAHRRGIPVIVADRRIGGNEFTAFVGGDNYEVGVNAAAYLAQQLPEGGKVVEITGKQGSNPVAERHQGFVDELSKHPRLQLIKSEDGYWLRDSAKVRMDQTLRFIPDVRAVFAHNDYMAMGASEMSRWVRSFRRRDSLYVPEWDPVFVGVDAVYGEDHGLEWVTHGDLDASVLYPTGGDVIVETAVKILQGETYEREHILPTFVVDARQAALLNDMDQAVIHEVDKVHWLQGREMQLLKRIDVEQWLLVVSGAFILFVIIAMLRMRSHYLERRRTALRLVRANRQLRDVANQKLQELQQQSASAATTAALSAVNLGRIETQSAASSQPLPEINPFIERVYQIIEQHYSEPDFGVEHLSVLLEMSRSQLYRKVKGLTGVTPFDMIRDKRFCEAERLLSEGLDYDQIASRVGFTSASYFERCFEEYRNISN